MKPRLMQHRDGSLSAVSAVPIAASAIAIATGCIVLAGWLFGLDLLTRLVPGAAAMNPVAAVCFVLLGASLALLRREAPGRTSRRIARVCSSLVVLIALFKLLRIVSGIEAFASSIPNGISLSAALDFVLLGCAALLLDSLTREDRWPAAYLILASMIGPLLNLICYVYGVGQSDGIFAHISMAACTGLAMVALSVGFLYARPDRGIMEIFTGKSMGGGVARKLLPAAILIPLVLGWLRLRGQLAGIYDIEFGVALFATAMVVAFAIVIGLSTFQLDRIDAERRRSEEALRRSEQQHKAVISNLPDAAVMLFDRDLRFNLVEGPAMWKLGWDREEIEGRTIYDSLPPERARELAPVLEKALTGEHHSFEWFSTRGNRYFWIEAVALNGEGDENSAGLLISRDITERVRAEEELRRSEERFRLLIEGVQDYAILTLDPEGNVSTWNSGAERIKGYKAEEIIGRNFSLFYTKEDIERDHPTEKLRVAAEVGRYEEEGIRIRKDGSRFWASVLITAMRDETGNLIGYSKVTRDITERKQAEEKLKLFNAELQRSNRELQEFASVASHDLQEPLRKVRAFGDRLSANHADELSPRAQDYLRRMQNAAERMQNLINDLLTYSRVTTRARPFVEVDLHQITREVLSDLETRIERTGVTVEVEDLPTIEGDPTQMRQVMQNLISNALKFHRDGEPPVVQIRSRIEDGMCEVSVEDRGIGFEEKHADRIFGIFERLHGRQEYEGTGVGLAICKKIVERHGGSMTARSKPGQGTTFVFTLPVRHEGGAGDA